MTDSKVGWYADPSTIRYVQNNPLHNNKFITKGDYQKAVIDLFAPIEPCFSKNGARLQLGSSAAIYDVAAAELEGFSRPLWGIVPLIYGGGEFPRLDIYLNGLTSGTDPSNPEYWGALKGTDQRMVEMAAIGLALLMVPDKLWTPLGTKAQQNLVNWLYSINEFRTPNTNWLFFRIIVNLGLKKVGQKHSKIQIESDFASIDKFYTSNGWYTDGKVNQLDYYIPFAMHYYGLLVSKLASDAYPIQAEKYRDRARKFAHDFRYWFGSNGSGVPFGRSMTYRFAQGAFWSAAAMADVEGLPWAEMKGYLNRHFRWWGEQPIADRDGVLSIGYSYPNLTMSEQYNAPGSPYWALKSFAALALPNEHKFWSAEETPASDLPPKSIATKPAGFLARRSNGDAVLLNGGQTGSFHRQNAAKYGKFAYSSEFAFSVSSDNTPSTSMERHAFDSTMAISLDGKSWYPRSMIEESNVINDLVCGQWQPKEGVKISSWQCFGELGWHFRVHQIETNVCLEMIETGFSIDRTSDHQDDEDISIQIEKNGVYIHTPFGTSGVLDIQSNRKPSIVQAWPNTNLRFPRTSFPQLKTKIDIGKTILVTAIFAQTGENVLSTKPDLPESIENIVSDLKMAE